MFLIGLSFHLSPLKMQCSAVFFLLSTSQFVANFLFSDAGTAILKGEA
jgi:hypothetical protein